jgi:hypothetical protein
MIGYNDHAMIYDESRYAMIYNGMIIMHKCNIYYVIVYALVVVNVILHECNKKMCCGNMILCNELIVR